ncbi:protein DpdH [Cupriavidus necator]|uniref:protein DpdH n=1 Tax=Cupriavidus necator TaxID=106590 RepID=UPI0005B467EA|nr:protein DpdH [Cupriavidus necator]
MTKLIDYWPSPAHVDECLRTEAETADQALLLAVHVPVTLKRRAAQAGVERDATESDLLEALLRPADDGSAVVVAVTGASGVGKSHMVRWLGAQLDRHPRRSGMVVVSIPKTASLRRVVELILEPLGGSEYEAFRQGLGRVVETLEPQMAAELLATALAEELERLAKRLAQEAQAARSMALGPRIDAARKLRVLMRDPKIRDLWFRSVLSRILGASLGGTADPVNRQFQAADFAVPDAAAGLELVNETQQALRFLASNNGVNLTLAAEVLQEVLDPALRTIFRFTEALQQRTIQEVVNDIRKQLLADGKELVLLIEDLAALSGIQQPLLDIMIAESDEHGVPVRAPIRTAVAVTDGFLAGRQTVLTRAREQWVVPSEGISEDTIARLLVELTGRYLNAARWGVEKLRADFMGAGLDLGNLYSWVPKYEPLLDAASSDTLRAFGESAAGYSLFPFNAAAVRSLAAGVLKIGNAWTFNPRAFINEVLRQTLQQRFAFEEGNFPPADFRNPALLNEVVVSLQYQGMAPEQAGRVKSALFHWGGNPQSLAMAPHVPRAVFDAFSVRWPFEADREMPAQAKSDALLANAGASTSVDPRHARDANDVEGRATSPVAVVNPPPPLAQPVSAYAQAIETWTYDTRLPNDFARRTRTLLVAALSQRFVADDWCLHGQKVNPAWLWMPPAISASNPTLGPMIRISPPDTPISPRVIVGLKALDRWDSNNRSWNYANAESDYAAASALLGDLEGQVLDLMLGEAVRDTGIAARALHLQNLLLGIAERPANPGLEDLLATAPDEANIAEDGLEAAGRSALESRRRATGGRSELQAQFRNFFACFQGSRGSTMLAIDTERLRQAMKFDVPQKWTFGLGGGESEAVRDILERLAPQNFDAFLSQLGAAVKLYLPAVVEAFGENHARVAWREAMRAVLQRAREDGVFPTDGPAASELHGAIERLSGATIESTIGRLRSMFAAEEGPEAHRRMLALSAVPLPQLIALHKDVTLLQRFLAALDKRIGMQTRSLDDQAAIEAHEALVDNLAWGE